MSDAVDSAVLPQLVSLPLNFRSYPCGKSPTDGSVEVDLGEWVTEDGTERFHLRINTGQMATLIKAIKRSRGESKLLYDCLRVFRVAGAVEIKT